MSDYDYDLFVIGAGSGGVRAARIASSHGARVAIAEEFRVGGTCVIRGCVPKKLLVYGAHFSEDLEDSHHFGWDISTKSFDWPRLRDSVAAEVDRLNKAYLSTLSNAKVSLYSVRATLIDAHSLQVGNDIITAKYILIATGARPSLPAVEGIEHAITSNEIFHLPHVPKRLAIAGGGYIATEFAGIFHEFGSQVTMVLRSDVVLRGYEPVLAERLQHISAAKGIDFKFHHKLKKIEKLDDGLRIHFEDHEAIEADAFLIATGRSPNTKGLGLEKAGVAQGAQGEILVDLDSRTNVENIYAVGDVTNRVQLTPVAIREGHAFADTIFGNKPWRVSHALIPSAVFCNPPIAAVGMTEAQARVALGDVKVFTADFRPMKNVLAGRQERAFYKLVCDAASGRVVGAHMIGPEAAEIMQSLAIAVQAGLTKEQIDATLAIHPTMAEEFVLMR